jgi:hypothetical protein
MLWHLSFERSARVRAEPKAAFLRGGRRFRLVPIADMGRIAGQSQLDLYSYLTERVQPLSASTPL